MSSSSYIAAAEVGGLRGALTVLGTLAFVGLCFLAVVMVDRRGGAAAAPTAAPGGQPTRERPSGLPATGDSVTGRAGEPDLTDNVVGAPGPDGAIWFDSDVPADDVWPLRSGRTTTVTDRVSIDPTRTLVATAGGSIGALLVAICLIPIRADIGLSSVVLALVLVIVAAAAFGGRVAAAVTSAVAALTFNFLHTPPLYNFHIAHGANVVTSILMIVVGVAVGELAVRNFRARSSHGTPAT